MAHPQQSPATAFLLPSRALTSSVSLHVHLAFLAIGSFSLPLCPHCRPGRSIPRSSPTGVLQAIVTPESHLPAMWSKASTCLLAARGSQLSHFNSKDPFLLSPPISFPLFSPGNAPSQGEPSQASVCGLIYPLSMGVFSVVTRLFSDASQLLATATGPPNMVACRDTAQTLDPGSSQSSSLGRMKLPAEGKLPGLSMRHP